MPLTERERRELDAITGEMDHRAGYTFRRYFPDEGPLRRELYPRSLQFFSSGKIHNERLFLAANRTSKTVSAAYEVTAHLTGDYPHWWAGFTFDRPTNWWAAGDTLESTRNVIQFELCGPRESVRNGKWAGMIPAHLILDRTLKSGGVPDCIDTLWIRHEGERVHGAPLASTLEFKAYNQGRLSFQGTSKDGIWLDEEPPDATDTPDGGGTPSGNGDIYTECLLRTATTQGLIIATFTPLRGLTPFIEQYLETAEMCDVTTGEMRNAKEAFFGKAA